MTYNVFSGTLNPTHFTSLQNKYGQISYCQQSRSMCNRHSINSTDQNDVSTTLTRSLIKELTTISSRSRTSNHRWLHFAWVVDNAKCIVATAICVSVPRRIPALLHRPGCNLGNGRVRPSWALLGRYAIGARVLLLWQHSGEHKISASASTHSCAWFYVLISFDKQPHTAQIN